MPEEWPFFYKGEKVFLPVHLVPQASRARIGETREGPHGTKFLTIYVTAPPVDGKANKEAIALLSRHLGLPKKSFHFHKGEFGRYKTLSWDKPSSD
ncbi:MAG: DUF167 domain-containing protein [Holosporales bacterium]|jgi:uncharacterized protein YggU (UPF0235/DUF167 family)|nr:DUF167 domain-containing protein [Holosporales bacterium]